MLELIGGELQHIDAAAAQSRRPSTAWPRLPPTATLRPAAFRIWPSKVVTVDLPLVPVMPTKRAFGSRAMQQLDVADQRQAGGLRRGRDGIGLREGGAGCRAHHQRGRPSTSPPDGDRRAAAPAHWRRAFSASSQAQTMAPRIVQRPRPQPAPNGRGRARPPPCSRRRGCGSGSAIVLTAASGVARPISARTAAMIQKRMTMVGSAQPFFSK